MPVRRAVLCVVDTSTGRLYPVKLTQSGELAILPVSLELDSVGVAREETLQAIRSQTDKLLFDEYGRLYIQNPPNMDIPLSSVRDNINISRVGGVAQTGGDWTYYLSMLEELSKSQNLGGLNLYTNIEAGLRCHDVVVDDVFAIPAGYAWYVKSVEVSGKLYIEGSLVVVN